MVDALVMIAFLGATLLVVTGLIILWGVLILFGKMIWEELFR